MRAKKYILIVPDDIYTGYLEDFVLQNLKMELFSTGCGTTKFQSTKKPRRFKERVLKNFGTCVFNNITLIETNRLNED
jgi:hypothetical protein